ncbi:hypothetical protein I4U23_025416 [Adineta vaga]|nr:hypothetical protein I4U23_025416 [Adineta vaga]
MIPVIPKENGSGPNPTALQCRDDPWSGSKCNSDDPDRCPKICLKEPGLNETSAGFQTDENRYYTLILAEKAQKR